MPSDCASRCGGIGSWAGFPRSRQFCAREISLAAAWSRHAALPLSFPACEFAMSNSRRLMTSNSANKALLPIGRAVAVSVLIKSLCALPVAELDRMPIVHRVLPSTDGISCSAKHSACMGFPFPSPVPAPRRSGDSDACDAPRDTRAISRGTRKWYNKRMQTTADCASGFSLRVSDCSYHLVGGV